MKNVIVVIGAGQIGQATARRVGAGKHVLLAAPDEVAIVGALLMGPDGGFISGSDFLVDGGVSAAYWYGELAPQ